MACQKANALDGQLRVNLAHCRPPGCLNDQFWSEWSELWPYILAVEHLLPPEYVTAMGWSVVVAEVE